MDFSVSGSDSWETTAFQENFIENYFQDQKLVASTSGNTLEKKRKRGQDRDLVEGNHDRRNKKKSVKLRTETINPKCSKVDSVTKFSPNHSGKKLKQKIAVPECTKKKASPESLLEDFEPSLISDDFQCAKNKSKKLKKVNQNSLVLKKSKLKEKQPMKLTKSVSDESSLPEPNILPQKSKKKKVKKGSQVQKKLESDKDIQELKLNSEDLLQESDEELVSEIKNSDIFKEIKDLMKQAPYLSNLQDSEDSFGELSAGDSDESESEETVKATKNAKKNTKLPENKTSLSKVKTCNADDKRHVPEKVSNTNEGFKEQDEKALIRNDTNSKRNTVTTLLRNKALEKLQAAKFRYLNEKLYTETGGSAFEYFQENEDEFHDYHQGYSLQVSKWPMNPVTKIISDLQNMNKNIVIADMGCGDAKIAQTLTKSTVHSFDIVALNEFVTACNISKVPLPKESVNVVVFCLSLMGTNLKEYLLEAHRILKMGGILKIAEVESRITDVNTFVKGLKCLGFSLQKQDLKHKIFVFLDLKKEKKKLKNAKIPNITLRPCLYKKR